MKLRSLIISLALLASIGLGAREKYNFNSDWLLKVGDIPSAQKTSFNDKDWEKVTLPHAFNEDHYELLKKLLEDLPIKVFAGSDAIAQIVQMQQNVIFSISLLVQKQY